jgi:hypothetical protein
MPPNRRPCIEVVRAGSVQCVPRVSGNEEDMFLV